MNHWLQILSLLTSIFLPIGFGYLVKKAGIFKPTQIKVLQDFVIRITIPFLIFKNLFKADISSIRQFFPAAAGLVILTGLFALTGYLLSSRVSPEKRTQNTYPLAVMAGNYAFLGWGVMYTLYGKAAFTRAVFFSILFWPTFLFFGFWLISRLKDGETPAGGNFFAVLKKNATVPLLSAGGGVAFNLMNFSLPDPLWNFVDSFGAITIPLILFTIGLNLSFRLPRPQIRILLLAAGHRLVFGFALGGATVLALKLIFSVDTTTLRVLLLQSTMPTAAMSPFFAEFIPTDKKLLSSIITFSTLLSLVSIPFWYAVIERIL